MEESDNEHEFDGNEEVDSEEEDDEKEEEKEDVEEDVEIKQDKKTDKNKIRNIIIVAEDNRESSNILQRNEISFIVSIRAKQIADTFTHFVKDSNKKLNEFIDIAYEELYTHRCPFILRRIVEVTNKGDIVVEEWDVKKMDFPEINV